jgi:hypothetical protein
MKSLALAITGLLISGKKSHGYSPNESFPEELFVFPEYAVYLMLALRIVLLILGDPWKGKTSRVCDSSCSWDGWRRVCACP